MKKWMSLLLAAMLFVTMLPASLAETVQSDTLFGFVVKQTGRLDLIGADTVLYEHEKTGAQVLLLANEDTNRTFEITFRTPTLDNKGIPHVFEHATLSGSEKYPSQSLFFNLSYQTYNTYMNASTYNYMTTYPVASLSEEQLLRYADFYTDSCFNPIIDEDESIFREEAWRYVMASPEDDLTIAGTVYSEMMGAYDLSNAAYVDFSKTLYPGSTAGNEHGGLPSSIPEMTLEDLRAYHDTYYHPSNSLTCLYGKFDHPEAFLELLDGYFSAYEKREIAIEDPNYEPLTGPVEKTWEYGLAAGASTAMSTIAYYGFVTPVDSMDTLHQLNLLTDLFYAPDSYFNQNMLDALPYAIPGCYIEWNASEPSIVFYATNLNEEDVETFKQVVEYSIKETAEKGIDPVSADAVAASLRLSVLLSGESSTVGVSIIPNIASFWAAYDDVNGYGDYVAMLDQMTDLVADGTMDRLVKEYLVENNRRALSSTHPVAGLKDEQDAALAAHLAEIKAAMTEEEIAAIVEATNAVQEQDDSSEYVRQLQAVTVETLPEETRLYDILDETGEDGVRRVDVRANVDGVGTANLMLDAGGLAQDQILYLQLYTDLIGSLDTLDHNRTELSSLCTRYLYSGIVKVSAIDTEEERGVAPYLRATFIALDEDIEAGYDLLFEMMFRSRLDSVDQIRSAVSIRLNSLRTAINADPYLLSMYRGMSLSSASIAYYYYINYLDYFDFLCSVQQLLDTTPEVVVEQLQAIPAALNNSNGAISGFVGSEESAANHREIADRFIASLDSREVEHLTYSLPVPAASEAFIVDSAVNYNTVFAPYSALGLTEFTGDLDALTSLVNDMFLMPMLRDQYGVYGVLHMADPTSGLVISSYRDPNIAESFNVYAQLPELIASAASTLDQETLDGYILSSYSQYAVQTGELTDGEIALLNLISHEPQDLSRRYMHELKQITPESVAAYADLYTKLLENGYYSTAGSASKITENANLYEAVYNPFSAEDRSKTQLLDVSEEDWYYESVRFCFETGFMAPVAEDTFGVAEPATLGELALGLYGMGIGETEDADEAIATLSQYGIMPCEPADTVLTRENLALYCVCFCEACGVTVTEVEPEGYADADQISDKLSGYVGWSLQEGLLHPDGDELIAPQAEADRADLAWSLYALYMY